MSSTTRDAHLKETLDWALSRMSGAGYPVQSKVSLVVDPALKFMGYAKQVDSAHLIVIAGWALDSEMLGGLVLHELAHIYHIERGSPTHTGGVAERTIEDVVRREGLSEREARSLYDAFSHLQNILVDDIVFSCMKERDHRLAARFFMEWVSDRPTGDPVVDATLVVRNAFAIASLKKRRVLDTLDEMRVRNDRLLSVLGDGWRKDFEDLERFLEQAKPEWGEKELGEALKEYLSKVLGLMSRRKGLEDLK
ncbi:MAG: hypothetical protein JRN39_04140 [Nitrososphaerota archaeon]|nr:hypothetical protein [Nitrososphaerota archaeon]MDG6939575.1 hypothetical protein [Nitrososphaerota archaeon]